MTTTHDTIAHHKKEVRDLVALAPLLSTDRKAENQQLIDLFEIIGSEVLFFTRHKVTKKASKKTRAKKVSKKVVKKVAKKSRAKKASKKKAKKSTDLKARPAKSAKKTAKKKAHKTVKVAQSALLKVWRDWYNRGGEELEKPFTDWASTKLHTTKTGIKYAIDDAVKSRVLRRGPEGTLRKK